MVVHLDIGLEVAFLALDTLAVSPLSASEPIEIGCQRLLGDWVLLGGVGLQLVAVPSISTGNETIVTLMTKLVAFNREVRVFALSNRGNVSGPGVSGLAR